MKHSVTTWNTKKTLAEALKRAMQKKPFSKITVSEIVADCGINRKTFYYHFEDIYALLKWMLEEEAIEVIKNFDLLVDYEEAITFVMNYVEENDHMVNCVYDAIGRKELQRFFYTDFYELIASLIQNAEKKAGRTLETDFKEFLTRFYTEALAGMLIEWITNRETRNRQQTVQYLSDTLKVSLTAIFDEYGHEKSAQW